MSPSVEVTLVCPACRGALRLEASGATCSGCALGFPIRDGIPDLWPEASDYYWGDLPQPLAREAVALIRRDGFEAAVEFISAHHADAYNYLKSAKRVDWFFHCGDSITHDNCLDLGSGWGSLSRPLARFFRSVWSVDGGWEHLQFQQAAAAQAGLPNLHFVRGRLFPLPFPDSSFDLVVANGILEWVGLMDPTRPVPELQDTFLREIRRVLKPEGLLYLGIENRYAFGNFAGARDHSDLPYTSLMPRWLASVAVRRFRQPRSKDFRSAAPWPDYRTWTYSLRGYRKLLRRAGFPAVSFAWAWPSYNLPWLSGDVESGRALSVFLDFMRSRAMVYLPRRTWRQRLIRWGAKLPFRSAVTAALRRVVPSFLIFARPQADAPARPALLQISGLEKIVTISPDGPALSVTKQPRFPEDAAALATEQELFRRFNPSVASSRREELRGRWMYREPYLDGRAPDFTSLDDQRAALRWLLAFQQQTRRDAWPLDALTQRVEKDLASAGARLREFGWQAEAGAGCQAFLESARAASLPCVAEHGDFWQANMILQPPDRLVVLDWQHFQEQGEPLFDLCILLFVHYCYVHHLSSRPAYRRAYARHTPLLIREFAAAWNLPPQTLLTYLPYFTVRYLLRHPVAPETLKPVGLLKPFSDELRNWLTPAEEAARL